MSDICPNCNTDLEGELVFETFMKKVNDRERAIEIAAAYGATETEGRWSRKIGIYSREQDRTVSYECPDCLHTWGAL